MINPSSARISARAAARAVACCSAAGIGLFVAYVAVDALHDAVGRDRSQGLGQAAAQGFSESALRSNGAAMTPGALAVALRHDPGADDGSDRQFSALSERLGRVAKARGVSRDAFAAPRPAGPFRPSGALAGAREMDCLSQAVYYEARGETPAGQAAVAQVVLNRVRHRAFPNSVCAVVFQGAQSGGSCQFSFACDGSVRRARNPVAWRRAQTVASRALGGAVMADVGTATHFHAARIGAQWGGMVQVAQVGLHVFYRFGGRAGSAPYREAKPEPKPQLVYASILPILESPRPPIAAAIEQAEAPTAALVKAVSVKPAEAGVEAAKPLEAKSPPDKTAATGAAPAKPSLSASAAVKTTEAAAKPAMSPPPAKAHPGPAATT